MRFLVWNVAPPYQVEGMGELSAVKRVVFRTATPGGLVLFYQRFLVNELFFLYCNKLLMQQHRLSE